MNARVQMNADDYDTSQQKKLYAIQGLLKSVTSEDIRHMPPTLMRLLNMQLEHVLTATTHESERRSRAEMERQKRERAREAFVREGYEAINGSTVRQK